MYLHNFKVRFRGTFDGDFQNIADDLPDWVRTSKLYVIRKGTHKRLKDTKKYLSFSLHSDNTLGRSVNENIGVSAIISTSNKKKIIVWPNFVYKLRGGQTIPRDE